MQIVEFSPGTLRFLDTLPQAVEPGSFVWVFLERETLPRHWPALQVCAQQAGGSSLLELHCKDLANDSHPSHYDYTSVYDLILFRRLATAAEAEAAPPEHATARARRRSGPAAFRRISTRAVGFAVFDRLLISIHPDQCYTTRSFIERYLADALHSETVSAAARSRLPASPADLTLRILNLMVDSYLDLRKDLSHQLEHWQSELLEPAGRFANWAALMDARSQLHTLEDLCEEQHDALQEWFDTLREQPPGALTQAEADALLARSRDVIEHIDRVMHHARRLEQSAETVVQIHFSAQSHRTNDIMRTLTALTAVFLPLNLITGFFGMNFEYLPLIHAQDGLWWAAGGMVTVALGLVAVFWRKRYLAGSGRRESSRSQKPD